MLPNEVPLVASDELVEELPQLRTIFACRPGQLSFFFQDHIGMKSQMRKHLRPKIGADAYGDRSRNEAGVEHLEQILVGQIRIDAFDRDRRFARFLEGFAPEAGDSRSRP